MQSADIKSVAILCAECFNGPFTFLDILSKKSSEDEYIKQLTDRYDNYVNKQAKHIMIVAENQNINSEKCEIVGFMELGTMLSPISKKSIEIWEGIETEVESRPELPFLGNVAVDNSYQRKGIGTKLVKLALKCAKKWQDDFLFLAVESDNLAAIKLYGKLQFQIILDESENISRPLNRTPRLYFEKELI